MKNFSATNYKLRDDPIIRFCAFYALIYLGSLIFGGIGVFLIVFGLMIFFTRVFTRTSIGQTHIRRFFGFEEREQTFTQAQSGIHKTLTNATRIILFSLYIFGIMFLIWTGIRFLLNDGFLNQNLIYILFFKFR